MQVGATSVVLPTKMAARTLHSRTRHTGPTHQGCIAPSGSSLPYLPITQWNSGGPPGNYHSFLNNRNLRPSKTAGEEDMPPANPDLNSVHSYLVAEVLCVLKPFFAVRGGLQKALTERFNDGEKDRWRQGEEQVGRDKGGQTVGEGKLLVFVCVQGKTNSCSVRVSLSLFPSTDLFNTCTFSPSRACSLSLSFPRHLVAVSIHV